MALSIQLSHHWHKSVCLWQIILLGEFTFLRTSTFIFEKTSERFTIRKRTFVWTGKNVFSVHSNVKIATFSVYKYWCQISFDFQICQQLNKRSHYLNIPSKNARSEVWVYGIQNRCKLGIWFCLSQFGYKVSSFFLNFRKCGHEGNVLQFWGISVSCEENKSRDKIINGKKLT